MTFLHNKLLSLINLVNLKFSNKIAQVIVISTLAVQWLIYK